jgi:methylglutaconyl-CoA hydratase
MNAPVEPLQVVTEGAVTRLTLARAELHNAFDDVLIAALTTALVDIARDESIRVVVLGAAGVSFSAGADLNWMQRMASASESDNRADAERLATLMATLDAMPQATIARVNGAAFGGGVGLVACCDLAIAAAEAKFGLTETKLGLVPAVISPYVLRAIGERQARRYFLSAETFDATRARDIGLVHEVVPGEQLDTAVARHVTQLLRNGPVAVREAKALVRRIALADGGARAATDRDNAALIARLRVSPEGQDGLGAFLERRKPRWIA